MSLKGWKALGALVACLAVAAAAVAALVGGCDARLETATGGCAHMACYYTFHAVALVEALGAFCIAGVAVVKCKMGRRWLAAACMLAQALALVALYTPAGGLCASAAMACHSTALVVDVLAAAICAGCIVAIALADPKRADLPKRGL